MDRDSEIGGNCSFVTERKWLFLEQCRFRRLRDRARFGLGRARGAEGLAVCQSCSSFILGHLVTFLPRFLPLTPVECWIRAAEPIPASRSACTHAFLSPGISESKSEPLSFSSQGQVQGCCLLKHCLQLRSQSRTLSQPLSPQGARETDISAVPWGELAQPLPAADWVSGGCAKGQAAISACLKARPARRVRDAGVE